MAENYDGSGTVASQNKGGISNFAITALVFVCKFWPFSLFKRVVAANLGKPANNFFGKYFMTWLLESDNADVEELAVNKCNLQPSDTVLEVGFGPGLGLKQAVALLSNSEGGMLHGLDYSESMMEVATNRLRDEINDGKVKLCLGSVDEMPFDSNMFDKIYHCNVYYFLKDRDSCCKELLRVLKSGGIMITVVNVSGIRTVVQNGVLTAAQTDVDTYMMNLSDAGFADVSMKEIGNGCAKIFWVVRAVCP